MTHRESRCGGATVSYSSMYTALVMFAKRWVDPDSAEDLVQEAFVRVMECGRHDAQRLPLAYYKAVVRNLALDMYARRSRDRAYTALHNEVPHPVIDAETAGATLLEDDLRDRLAELSKRQWESLVMTVVLGMSEREAASAADVSRSAVSGSRERALQWLRESLPAEKPPATQSPPAPTGPRSAVRMAG